MPRASSSRARAGTFLADAYHLAPAESKSAGARGSAGRLARGRQSGRSGARAPDRESGVRRARARVAPARGAGATASRSPARAVGSMTVLIGRRPEQAELALPPLGARRRAERAGLPAGERVAAAAHAPAVVGLRAPVRHGTGKRRRSYEPPGQ